MRPLHNMVLFEALERRQLLSTSPAILFVRGATRSAGFLEGVNAVTRNEQLADINNTSTTPGNAGWATLAAALRDRGFVVDQVTEPKGADAPTSGFVPGHPIHFENLDLAKYAAIVFGSNNARYPRASIDAVDQYIDNGGGALFISDANFGSHWRDAPDSDQQFLARFGLIVNQDAADPTTTLTRAGGDFIAANHPVPDGINAINGEGVSALVVPDVPPPGVTFTRVLAMRGMTRNNNGTDPANQFQGTLRNPTSHDAALVLANSGRGRLAAYFDRNTFFNPNGVGTDITQLDNRQLALNLFDWVTDHTPPIVIASSFRQGAPSEVRLTFDDDLFGSLTRGDVLLRNAIDGTPIPRKRWSFSLLESPSQTELIVRVKGAQPPGTYQLQINPGHIRDDSGNVNPKRIRFNFTIK